MIFVISKTPALNKSQFTKPLGGQINLKNFYKSSRKSASQINAPLIFSNKIRLRSNLRDQSVCESNVPRTGNESHRAELDILLLHMLETDGDETRGLLSDARRELTHRDGNRGRNILRCLDDRVRIPRQSCPHSHRTWRMRRSQAAPTAGLRTLSGLTLHKRGPAMKVR